MSRTFSLMVAALLAGALAACSASSSPSSAASKDDGGANGLADGASTVVADGAFSFESGAIVDCTSDPRITPFAANMSLTSPSGALKVTLTSAAPAPPALNSNVWTIVATDASGAAIDDATLSVIPWMPDHGHGTSIVAAITPGPAGAYNLDPLYFFMPGVWRITIAVQPDAGTPAPADSVEFYFCIEG